MNYEKLKDGIRAVIRKNGRQEITGKLLQDVLLAMTDILGKYGQYAGVAKPETVPAKGDENMIYMFSDPGEYTHFGAAIEKKCLGVFRRARDGWTTEIIIDEIGGGGGGSYVLPVATERELGGVKAGGKGIKIGRTGVIEEDPTTSVYDTKEAAGIALAKKADKAAVEEALGRKAETSIVNQELAKKQDTLTPGTGIAILNDVISCTLDTTIFKVLDVLPDKPAEGDDGKIHVVPDPGKVGSYIEYIWVVSSQHPAGKWEELGKFDPGVDLSQYVKKSDMPGYFLDGFGDDKEKGVSQYALTKRLAQVDTSLAKKVEQFDATELYLAAVKGENGGKVSQEFMTGLLAAIEASSVIYLENVEPNGFKFKVMVVFAGIDESDAGFMNFNASDSKAHYKLVLNKATREVLYEIHPIYTPEVDHGTGDAVFALTPNVYHIWGEMPKLEVSESAGEQGQMNVYMFEFTSGASATQLTYPGTWKWMGGTAPVIAPNKRYQIGVLNNLAKIDEYE